MRRLAVVVEIHWTWRDRAMDLELAGPVTQNAQDYVAAALYVQSAERSPEFRRIIYPQASSSSYFLPEPLSAADGFTHVDLIFWFEPYNKRKSDL